MPIKHAARLANAKIVKIMAKITISDKTKINNQFPLLTTHFTR